MLIFVVSRGKLVTYLLELPTESYIMKFCLLNSSLFLRFRHFVLYLRFYCCIKVKEIQIK